MKWINKWFETKVDERQEQDLLRIEHMGFWSMYWMLLAAMVIQIVFVEDGGRLIMGEWVVFMLSSVLLVAACVRKGVWCYHTRKVPGVKAYLRYSLIAMIFGGIPLGLLNGFKNTSGEFKEVLISVILNMVYLFAIAFPLFLLVGTLAKKREAKLAEADMEDEEDL